MVYRDGFGNIKQDMVMERDPANLHRKVEHIECQLADLRKENARLKAEVEKQQECQSCGEPLSRDCPRCKRLWES